jgi:hypothetical protein
MALCIRLFIPEVRVNIHCSFREDFNEEGGFVCWIVIGETCEEFPVQVPQ